MCGQCCQYGQFNMVNMVINDSCVMVDGGQSIAGRDIVQGHCSFCHQIR